MSRKVNNRKWYERVGVVTGIGVLIGIVFGLGRNDLIFGIVMGFFLGLGVPIGAVGARLFSSRNPDQGNVLAMSLVLAIVAGVVVTILSSAIGGILESVQELLTNILEIALNSGSDVVWGIAIGIGTAVGAVLRAKFGEKGQSQG